MDHFQILVALQMQMDGNAMCWVNTIDTWKDSLGESPVEPSSHMPEYVPLPAAWWELNLLSHTNYVIRELIW
jgi:hypothetical protein